MILTEIDWLPKASLIALETAAESRRASVSDSALRWLITVSSTFQDVDFDGSLLPLFIT